MDIQELVRAQRDYFLSGATRSCAFRMEQLKKLQRALQANEALLEQAMYQDFRKAPMEVYMCETGMVLEEVRFHLKHLKGWMRERTVPTPLAHVEKKDFDFVTSVNYTGFFLCAKYAAIIMEAEHEADPEAMFDIVTLNSKSGLEGSNKNFAYAGSKFGGIGLTQSFALELCAYNIKVNAVCPGNFLDGPLWSDPVRGLFVQYLEAGKVPGAKTVADVRRYYEAKVPMNRGCLPVDVARAVMYCVEQKYETGQAIPVTGGQVMLN